MPQLVPLTLKGAATEDHVFTPVDIRQGVSTLSENLAVGSNTITQSVLPFNGKRTQGKRRFALELVRTDANGQPFVAATAYAHAQYDIPEVATEAERQLLAGLVKNGAADAVWIDAIVTKRNYY